MPGSVSRAVESRWSMIHKVLYMRHRGSNTMATPQRAGSGWDTQRVASPGPAVLDFALWSLCSLAPGAASWVFVCGSKGHWTTRGLFSFSLDLQRTSLTTSVAWPL